MVHALNIVGDIEISYMTNFNVIGCRPERTQWLRCKFFYFVRFKNLVDTKNQEDE